MYRFGTKDKIELEFPNDITDSWNQFIYYDYHRPRGVSNDGFDSSCLYFEKEDYEYRVHHTFDYVEEKTSVWVNVKSKVTGKVTNIDGDENSLIGSLQRINNDYPKLKYEKWW